MNIIMRSRTYAEVLLACETLTADTLQLVQAEKKRYSTEPSYSDRMKGFYEEEKGILDKIITAYETNDL
ncbi:MAG: hypothetical protein K6T83_13155 [Alicyclobacillus sp.]|nr:hypothetical protein [Alicyclobacillus sp.]